MVLCYIVDIVLFEWEKECDCFYKFLVDGDNVFSSILLFYRIKLFYWKNIFYGSDGFDEMLRFFIFEIFEFFRVYFILFYGNESKKLMLRRVNFI